MNQTEDSVVNDELLLARRLRTLKVLDKIGVWDIVESPEQATNTMEVVQKIAAGDVPSGNVIALLKGKLYIVLSAAKYRIMYA